MNKTKNAESKGITLIALIITIIIMLILVTVSITMAVKGGLFKYASDAGKKTNEAIQDEQKLATLEEGLSVDQLIAKFTQTNSGWYEKTDGVFTNGTYTVNLGDYIDYKCWNNKIDEGKLTYTSPEEKNGYSDQTFTVNSDSNTIKWQVLGVENGQLLIVMKGQAFPADSEWYYLFGAEALKYGIDELNEISKIYGHGKNSTGARSITVEDVNKIAGYDPLHDSNYDGKPFADGEVCEYGNEVTYKIDGNGKVNYKVNNGDYISTCDIWTFVNIGESSNISNPLTVKSTYYCYNEDIVSNKTRKSLVFLDGDSDFWLASPYVYTFEDCVSWGLRLVQSGTVSYGEHFWNSIDDRCVWWCGVRPVVSLKSDIKLTKDNDNADTWNIATTQE